MTIVVSAFHPAPSRADGTADGSGLWRSVLNRRKKIEEYLQNEIDTYNEYLHGEVYGFQVTPEDDDTEILDSCWGFFGDDGLDQLKSECQAYIDDRIAEDNRQKQAEYLCTFGLELPFPEFALSTN